MSGEWPARFGVTLEGREALADIPALARAAEAGGAGTLWVSSHLYLRDPITMAHVALAATMRLRVAIMAISPYAMHPVHIAMACAALSELFPGRVVLCLGAGAPADREAAGLETPLMLAGMREAVTICRGLFAGEAVKLEGKVFRPGGQRGLVGGAVTQPIPVILAASQPGMLKLAGQVADGVLLSGGSSPAFVKQCLATVAEGAKGRRLARMGLVYGAPVAPGQDRAQALHSVRRRLAFVLRGQHHAGNLAAAGTVLDQARLWQLTQAGDWPAAIAMISEQVVANHALAGETAQIAAGVAAFREAGLDEVALANLPDPAAIGATLAAVGAP